MKKSQGYGDGYRQWNTGEDGNSSRSYLTLHPGRSCEAEDACELQYMTVSQPQEGPAIRWNRE